MPILLNYMGFLPRELGSGDWSTFQERRHPELLTGPFLTLHLTKITNYFIFSLLNYSVGFAFTFSCYFICHFLLILLSKCINIVHGTVSFLILRDFTLVSHTVAELTQISAVSEKYSISSFPQICRKRVKRRTRKGLCAS